MVINRIAIAVLICTIILLATIWLSPTNIIINNPPPHASSTKAEKNIDPEKTVSAEMISQWVNNSEQNSEQDEIFFKNPPYSLRNSAPPVKLGVDPQGDLIVDMRVRNLFEYYLTAMGEESVEELIKRIQHELHQQLFTHSGNAYSYAMNILEGYIQLRNHQGEIKNEYMALYGQEDEFQLPRVAEMKMRVRESRSLFLDNETILAFYKKEDEYDSYMMEQAQIQTNPDMDEQAKTLALQRLIQDAPEWIQQQNDENKIVENLRDHELKLIESGATESDIQQARTEQFGEDAAALLKKLDERRAQWRLRVNQYRSEAIRIVSSDTHASDYDRLLQDLRRQHFEANELIRIQALDQLELGEAVAV